MGYFHSALGWKRSAPAQPASRRGTGLAVAGRVATGGRGVPLPPRLPAGTEHGWAGKRRLPRVGASQVLRPPQQHPEPGHGWRMLRPQGAGEGGHPRSPGARPRSAPLQRRGAARVRLPAPTAGGRPASRQEMARKGDPAQTHRRLQKSSPPTHRIYRKSLH